jgi:hypothetical protein
MVRSLLSRRPSAAGVVALLALVLATAGTATAAHLVTSKDIKNNSIKSKDVKNGTLRGGDVRADALGGTQVNEAALGKVPSAGAADTAANATNAANAAALGGTAAAAHVRNVEHLSSSDAIGTNTKQTFVNCPAGKVVIGGGAQITGTEAPGAFLQTSRPIVNNTQWFAQARNPGATDFGLTATVICANVG